MAIVLILLSTIGVTVTRHYCGDILQGIGINYEPNCCGDEEMPKGCCHNEAERIVLEDDLQLGVFDFEVNFHTIDTIVHLFEDYINILHYEAEVHKSKFAFRSDPPAESDIYIKIQSFLI